MKHSECMPGQRIGTLTLGASVRSRPWVTSYSASDAQGRERVVDLAAAEVPAAASMKGCARIDTQLVAAHVPHRVRCLEAAVDTETGLPYAIFEKPAALSLDQVVELCPLTLDEALRMFDQLAACLDAAHAQKRAHGALQPSLLFLGPSPDMALFVARFGALELAQTAPLEQRVAAEAPFLAPEQLHADIRSDAFAVDVYQSALVLFYALTGKSPWRSCAKRIDVAAWREECLRPIGVVERARELGVRLDDAVGPLFAKALSTQGPARFRSVGEFAAALRVAFKKGEAPHVAPERPPTTAAAAPPARPNAKEGGANAVLAPAPMPPLVTPVVTPPVPSIAPRISPPIGAPTAGGHVAAPVTSGTTATAATSSAATAGATPAAVSAVGKPVVTPFAVSPKAPPVVPVPPAVAGVPEPTLPKAAPAVSAPAATAAAPVADSPKAQVAISAVPPVVTPVVLSPKAPVAVPVAAPPVVTPVVLSPKAPIAAPVAAPPVVTPELVSPKAPVVAPVGAAPVVTPVLVSPNVSPTPPPVEEPLAHAPEAPSMQTAPAAAPTPSSDGASSAPPVDGAVAIAVGVATAAAERSDGHIGPPAMEGPAGAAPAYTETRSPAEMPPGNDPVASANMDAPAPASAKLPSLPAAAAGYAPAVETPAVSMAPPSEPVPTPARRSRLPWILLGAALLGGGAFAAYAVLSAARSSTSGAPTSDEGESSNGAERGSARRSASGDDSSKSEAKAGDRAAASVPSGAVSQGNASSSSSGPVPPKMAEAVMECVPDCEKVLLDGKPVDYTKPLLVKPGLHAIAVHKKGYVPIGKQVTMPAGERTVVHFDLKTTAEAKPSGGAPARPRNCGKFLKRCD